MIAVEPTLAAWLETLDLDAREYFEERAAIIEYEGKSPRPEAERIAQRLTLAYLQRRELTHDHH